MCVCVAAWETGDISHNFTPVTSFATTTSKVSHQSQLPSYSVLNQQSKPNFCERLTN